jgi:hypothetical protein
MKNSLSLIIPIKDGHLSPENVQTLNELSPILTCEVIIVNHGIKCSAERHSKYKVLEDASNSRAQRINHGVEVATADIVVLLHPRSYLEPKAFEYLSNETEDHWGGFTHGFNTNGLFYKFTSWYSNEVRGRIRNIIYLDHCIFVRRDLFNQVGGIPDIDIFEDTALSERLNSITQGKILPFLSVTSAVRFQKNGILRQGILNQVLKLAYMLKLDHKTMNKIYEYGLNLNSKY